MSRKRSGEPARDILSTPNESLGEAEAPEGIPGRRLRLIPHTVDPKLVFRFEFGPAILAQVWEQLQNLPILPLQSQESITARYPGFYQLLRNESPVYIGKSTRPIG